MLKPIVSPIVYYMTKYGKRRPAIMVEANEDGTVNLQVFTDAESDPPGSFRRGSLAGAGTAYVPDAPYSEDLKPFTWHWPEHAE